MKSTGADWGLAAVNVVFVAGVLWFVWPLIDRLAVVLSHH